MSITNFTINEFPDDDELWVIRFVDKVRVPNGSSATPSITVWLSKLKSGDGDYQTQFKRPKASIEVEVHIAAAPLLSAGMLVKNKKICGYIPSKAYSQEFSLNNSRSVSAGCDLSSAPPWWNPSLPYRYINKSEFSLIKDNVSYIGAKFIALQNANMTLLIPQSIIFQTFYAPQSDLAIALTSGPWNEKLRRIVIEKDTYIRSNGEWQIRLADRIKNDYAPWVGQLILDEFGRNSAKAIHSHLINDPKGYLNARIPFSGDLISFDFNAVVLHTNPLKLLCLTINSCNWPQPRVPYYLWRQGGQKGKTTEQVDLDKPYAGGKDTKLSNKNSPDIPITSMEDPNYSSYSELRLMSRHFQWRSPPESKKYEKEVSGEYNDGANYPLIEQRETTSLALPKAGHSSAAESKAGTDMIDYTSGDHAKVLTLFCELKKSGAIRSWQVLPCPQMNRFSNGYSVWAAAPRIEREDGKMVSRSWATVDRKGTHARTAIAILFTFPMGGEYLWVEFDRSSTSLRSLILPIDNRDPISIMRDVCKSATRYRGCWANAEKRDRNWFSSTVTWKHHQNRKGQLCAKSVKRRFAEKLGVKC